MLIQIVSDLHVEFWKGVDITKHIKPSAPILALLGDICCAVTEQDFILYKTLISQLLPHYQHIIIIAGNHEYYNNGNSLNSCTINATNMRLKNMCKISKKLHFLSNNTFKIKYDNIVYMFIGSTLWSYIPDNVKSNVQTQMTDYTRIYTNDSSPRLITPNDVCTMYKKNVAYLTTKIKKAHDLHITCIVFTHHKPYLKSNHNTQSCDPAYESDLKYLFPYVKLWAYGHTHITDNRKINGCRVYSNPHGYPHERTGYSTTQCAKI
jgi:predicted phosphodiesterase